MNNEKCLKEINNKSREDNTSSPYYYNSKLLEHINYDIIELHLSNLNNFKRTLSILRKRLLVKSIEIESKGDLHDNDITVIAELSNQIIKLVVSSEHMNASTVWIYQIKNIIDEIVSKKKQENNNYLESSLDFDKIKSYLVTYHENYINELKTARSNLNTKKDHNKNYNKEEIKYSNLITDRLDELISKAQNVLSTIKKSSNWKS